MYRIALTPDKRMPGIRTWPTEDRVPLFETFLLHDALNTHFTTDAHFVAYAIRDSEGVFYGDPKLEDAPEWPRINRTALPPLRKAGAEVLSTLLVYDYDLKDNVEDPEDKVPWAADYYRMFVDETLPRLRKTLGNLFATYVYLTKHGARFIHVLATPLPVDEAEGYWNALFEKYEQAGVKVDPACKDWGRMFRLSQVIRDGVSTWTGYIEQFGIAFNPDNFVVPKADLTPVDWKKTRDYSEYLDLKLETMDTPMPEFEVAMALVRSGKRQTHAYKKAREVLQGRNCYRVFFENEPVGSPGNRDHRLTSLVGEACRMLSAYNTRTGTEIFQPEHVYALFLPALDDLESDSGTPSWHESAWGKILRFWAAVNAQIEAEHKQTEERARDNVHTRLDGLRSWTDCPQIHDADDDRAIEFMTTNLILPTPRGDLIVLQEDGRYSRPVSKAVVYAALQRYGLTGDLVQDVKIGNDGAVKGLVPVPELLKYYGFGTALVEVCSSVAEDHPVIQGFGTAEARVVYPMARLNSRIAPCYMESVETWLKYLVGGTDLPRLKKWLAYALDFRAGPIAALALIGPPSIGKKLLVQGLAECFEDHTVVPGQCLIETFQREMTRSVIVHIDEGLPKDGPGVRMAFKDKIRSLTAGDPTMCNVKYGDPISVRAPFRILLTANNDSIVAGLVGLQLEQHDPEALGMRVLRIEGRRKAADYLERLDTRGKRWITGDSGAPSNYVIAKHFLWLYANKETFGEPEGRFLVQGNTHDGIRKSITESASAQAMLHALVKMVEEVPSMKLIGDADNAASLNKKVINSILDGMSFNDGHVWVTMQAVRDFCELRDIEIPRRDKQARAALVAMAPQEAQRDSGAVRALRITLRGKERNVRWWPVDSRWIMDYAFDSGICEPLELMENINGK
jgi:hypothetical protein